MSLSLKYLGASTPAGQVLLILKTHGLGRRCPLVLMTTPYVRVGGLGSELVTNLPRRAAIGSVGVAFAFAPSGSVCS